MITRAARLMGPAGGLRPVAGYDGIQSSRDARARQSANVRPRATRAQSPPFTLSQPHSMISVNNVR